MWNWSKPLTTKVKREEFLFPPIPVAILSLKSQKRRISVAILLGEKGFNKFGENHDFDYFPCFSMIFMNFLRSFAVAVYDLILGLHPRILI
mgnify:CR=1 FL=1